MISATNFEMYCMLYADGELSPAEIQELQAFLAANPDLEPEWKRWQQLKLSAPSIQFPQPEQLMQPGSAIISEADAWLYLDGELPASEHPRIEALLQTNAEARKRVEQLECYKLSPDFVACPDKASLYKNEKTPRIIAFRSVIRFAAAALIGWLLYTYFPSVSKTNLLPAEVVTQPNAIREVESQDLNAAPNNAKVAPNMLANSQPTHLSNHSLVTTIEQVALQSSNKAINNAVSSLPVENNTLAKTNPVKSIEPISAPPTEISMENLATQFPEVKAETTTPVQSVLYKELDIQSTRETITIGTMEIREGKVRGIIRTARALFKNKNSSTSQQSDEYKVLPAVQIIQN
ncbi:MAG: hypothetical protein FGM61_12605 [Sediminibacterium sp.]|nr:hypothetical protein [Sediminibacterium sp.]